MERGRGRKILYVCVYIYEQEWSGIPLSSCQRALVHRGNSVREPLHGRPGLSTLFCSHLRHSFATSLAFESYSNPNDIITQICQNLRPSPGLFLMKNKDPLGQSHPIQCSYRSLDCHDSLSNQESKKLVEWFMLCLFPSRSCDLFSLLSPPQPSSLGEFQVQLDSHQTGQYFICWHCMREPERARDRNLFYFPMYFL